MGQSDIRLTSTSYIVLGMLDWLGPSSPYRLKRVLSETIEDFFPVPHTSFYAEPARLARAGYVRERQERGGRRRKTYELAEPGRAALEAWLADPSADYGQFRFPGMLKLFFGADPAPFATDQAAHHRALAEKFKAVREEGGSRIPPRRRIVLDTGIGLHEWWERAWEQAAAKAKRSRR